MRDDTLTGLGLVLLGVVAGVATYAALGAPLAAPRGIQVLVAIGWALWPLVAAWGLLGWALVWLWARLARTLDNRSENDR